MNYQVLWAVVPSAANYCSITLGLLLLLSLSQLFASKQTPFRYLCMKKALGFVLQSLQHRYTHCIQSSGIYQNFGLNIHVRDKTFISQKIYCLMLIFALSTVGHFNDTVSILASCFLYQSFLFTRITLSESYINCWVYSIEMRVGIPCLNLIDWFYYNYIYNTTIYII